MTLTMRSSHLCLRQGESPIDGIHSEALVKSMIDHGHKDARTIASLDDLPETIKALAKPGGMVVCLGAGSISAHANALVEKLSAR